MPTNWPQSPTTSSRGKMRRYSRALEALPQERILGVETGGCPHTAIREDISANLEAVEQITADFPDLDILFLESGGDNLAAFFSPELVDAAIYVIDVAGGDKIPRKGGPGITRSDLLIINKIDLAEYVGADLGVMARDTKRMRGEKPAVFTDLRKSEGLEDVISWIQRELLFEEDAKSTKLDQLANQAIADFQAGKCKQL